MYRAAMRCIFSELLRQERLLVVSDFTLAEPKTKLMLARLADLGIEDSALLITEAQDQNLYRSARNLPNVELREVNKLDPIGLIRYDKVIITTSALEKVEEWLA
jgi:large subunit ribosomal protein L4